jgi:hypothetical protein
MSTESVNRRDFAKRVALGATVPLTVTLETASVAADQKPQQTENLQPGKKPPVKPPSQADLSLEVIKQRYPDKQLDESVLSAIRNDLRGDIARSKVLSSFPLKNSDEPRFVFAAYRNDN